MLAPRGHIGSHFAGFAYDAEDFADPRVRADFQNLEATRELYVIETQTVNLPPERLRDVSVRIKRIHDAIVR